MNANPTVLYNAEQAVEWLKKLNARINREIRGTLRANMSGTEVPYIFVDPIRNLTASEWKRVAALIPRFELPCELGSDGFTWMLNIYGHQAHMPLPGIEPERVLQLKAKQIPVSGTHGDLAEKEAALKNLGWLTHNRRNKEVLAWYRLRQPREPSHYMY